ncbi:uncharacterized protein DNG_00539 [Cephalotrichum gorgonifer]|uniref:Uncharacterized protein n=1 Tax=Cephalotrichum gorgonifer TaxID=2041049 RepID=A0AAE8MPC7_9PEZI|nr:uncharacterized protein DNG_00539 [Cephalotrichum gorgonifer]
MKTFLAPLHTDGRRGPTIAEAAELVHRQNSLGGPLPAAKALMGNWGADSSIFGTQSGELM